LQWRQDSGTVQTEAVSGAESFLNSSNSEFLLKFNISNTNHQFGLKTETIPEAILTLTFHSHKSIHQV
jgi:hypothetical protein